MAIQFALDLSTQNPNGDGTPVYNFDFGYPTSNGWSATHEATGGPSGAPCVHVVYGPSSEQTSGIGWNIDAVGGSYTQGVSKRYVRFRIRFDNDWQWSTNGGRGGNNKFIEWGGTTGRVIIYITSPADSGSRLTLDAVDYSDDANDPDDSGNGQIFAYCKPSHFGLTATPDRFLSSTLAPDYGGIIPSLGVGGEAECGRPICVHRGNLGTPVRPGASGAGAAPVDGWYHVQIMAQSGAASIGGGLFQTWCNNNTEASPTSTHGTNWYLANGMSVEGWGDQQLYFGHFIDTGPGTGINLGYRLAGLEIGDTFDPNWFSEGAPPAPTGAGGALAAIASCF
jgi:hypothetical protein